MPSIDVTDNPRRSRYEARIDGTLAGFAAYDLADDRIVFTHTEVEPQYEGRGVGSALAQAALDAVRAEDTRRVVPRCLFIKGWIDRNPDYADLVGG